MSWLFKSKPNPSPEKIANQKWENYGRCLITEQKRPNAVMRLFCFPYAGASASVFLNGWSKTLPPQIEYISIQLPARSTRIDDPVSTDMRTLAKEIVKEMAPLVAQDGTPFAIYAHSLGTLVAWEVAHELKRMKLAMPKYLLFSGRGAPATQQPFNDRIDFKLPDKEFAQVCISQFGPSPGLVDKQMWPLTLPPLRNDIELFYSYTKPRMRALRVPICVWGADGDPISVSSQIETWETFTTQAFTTRSLPLASHQFSSHPTFLKSLTEYLTALIVQCRKERLERDADLEFTT
ncbi:putative Gramicidin S biosynthesis protein GrsT [Blattamonas nauphoetae]|uniref:Gramicidin S biosynthesis protein GrsT n=1 Tax=Blattamonas nauphoetae TaxID=2049346 RepID=A0ABQ9WTY9_9EUKA|nr:putative Gramicidin S biosynthesis protein GrsT [Blattamonas nauphoetae]